ncbi:hypothetical protein [Shewanella sedimentimangrovi]|uniref:Uncharacterized protein n=1 Tax=Shewanella sedimentimangrovi TaxID=2814293 RepID=A0ABX7R6E0_9GAMM|nr:hypothetical protein [Shewanella sedimentimangrovi]QSX38378.1 hypothetical protein JYB85_06020 [Shewanella sedimentimangrovi]
MKAAPDVYAPALLNSRLLMARCFAWQECFGLAGVLERSDESDCRPSTDLGEGQASRAYA